MNQVASVPRTSRIGFAQITTGLVGAGYVLTGLALLAAPVWFFQTIGPYAPYNRHYEGDVGAFILGWGVGLLVAARDPARHRLLIGAAGLASLVHALNHVYDSLIGTASLSHWLFDTMPLLIVAGLLLLAARER